MRKTQISGRLDYLFTSPARGRLSVCASVILLVLLAALFTVIARDFDTSSRMDLPSLPGSWGRRGIAHSQGS